MASSSPGLLAAGVVGLTAVVLLVIGTPGSRKPPAGIAATSAAPPPSSVSGNGFTLASIDIALPIDAATYPAGPNVDVVNANCTACHSTSMVLNQPRLTAEQWTATVTKMREVYHAPLADRDVPAIIAYLTAMPGQTAASEAGKGKVQDVKPAIASGGR